MPRGKHLPKATAREQRQYEHILESEMKRGRSTKTAKRIAAATVRKGQSAKRNPKQSKAKTALKTTGRALKGATRGVLAAGSQILGAGAKALNPTLYYWNVYLVNTNVSEGSPYRKRFVDSSPFGVSKSDAIARVRRSHYPGRLKPGQKLIAEKAAIEDRRKTNPRKRLKVRNRYIDLVIKGNAKKTPQGWSVGGKTYAQGKGTVKLSSGYYLDKATGFVYAKRERNIAGYKDESGQFHPIRSGMEATGKGLRKSKKPYRPSAVGEKSAYSARKSAKRASQSKRIKSAVKARKATTSRLAGRSLKKSAGMLKRRRNVSPKTQITDLKARWVKLKYQARKANLDAWRVGVGIGDQRKWTQSQRDHYWRLRAKAREYERRATELKRQLDELTKKNPSPDSIRKDFAGRVGKGAELYFPEGTPTGLAKLGKLVSITTEEGTLKPVSGTAWLCSDTKGKLHIGSTSNKPLWDGSAHSFGSVKQVEYEEVKKHLGYGNNPITFFHKMGEENGVKPKLYADGKGGLKFKGGAYRITREGIVN
jgi:hypothetical protein